MKIILLNAPPLAGKDTAAAALVTAFENLTHAGFGTPYIVAHHKLAETLKKGAHALFGVDASAEYLEANKDVSLPEFMGMTPRQVYIDLSEKFVKPLYGKHAFGWMFVNRLRAAERLANTATGHEYLCICSDLGFVEELKPLIAAYGAENILLMHIVRPDFTFEDKQDSRSYIQHEGVRVKTIVNRASVEQLQLTCIRAAHDWLQEKAPAPHANTSTSA
jgi:hypothetical protein